MLEISKKNYFSLLIAALPISFIAGNMIININVIVLLLSALIFYGKEIFKIKYYLLDKFILIFFGLVLFTGIVNDLNFFVNDLYPKGFNTIIKSILFLKYLFLYMVLRFLIEKEDLDLKFFFLISSFGVLFVCFDIFYQFKFGEDIFGLKPLEGSRKLSGPFGDELIAGSYIQRFFLFSFFIIPLFYNSKEKYLKIFIFFLLLIFTIGLILSGNRMPFILFIFIICLFFLFQHQLRKFLIVTFLFTGLTFTIFYNFNEKVYHNFHNFYERVNSIITIIIQNDYSNPKAPDHIKEFVTFYDTWKMNKYLGGGIKNFRWYCHHRQPGIHSKPGFICNMHPHNYYLEILTETGLVGFILIAIIFFITLRLTLQKIFFSKGTLSYQYTFLPFLLLFIAEIFPLKSTGSFFTTINTTYLFLILGIMIGLTRKYNSFENEE